MNWQIFRCLVGRHEHAQRMSRDEKGVVRSRCTGCGRRLVRIEEGTHRVWKPEKNKRE